jgi:hypothetical protein
VICGLGDKLLAVKGLPITCVSKRFNSFHALLLGWTDQHSPMFEFNIVLHCVKRRLSNATCSGIHACLRIGHSSIGRVRTGLVGKSRLARFVDSVTDILRWFDVASHHPAFVDLFLTRATAICNTPCRERRTQETQAKASDTCDG